MKLRIGHTPDADDAFMFAGLASGAVRIPECEVEYVLEDVQSLNARAEKGELEVTAISAAAYPALAGRYRILSAGSSIGRNYGPVLVALKGSPLTALKPSRGTLDLGGCRVAVPGKTTTASLLLRLFARRFEPCPLPFEDVIPAVQERRAEAGVVIHEGQITYFARGLVKILDLGMAWGREVGLPIPLGLTTVRRDLGDGLGRRVNAALRESILWAQAHRKEAMDHALRFARGVDAAVLEQFVTLYVNKDTLDLGPDGKAGLAALFRMARESAFSESVPALDIVP